MTNLTAIKWGLLFACLTLFWLPVRSQAPFERTGQVFMLLPPAGDLVEMSVHPSFQTLVFSTIAPGLGSLDALGFRKTDNLLYGLNELNNQLVRIDANGTLENLGAPALDNALYYLAGDISPDGKFLTCVGSNSAGSDVHLAKIDLETAGYPVTFAPLSGNTRFNDIAFDPYSGTLFGYDAANRKVVKINTGNGTLDFLAQIGIENEIHTLFFDAFGDLYAYGPAVNGIVDGIFSLNKNTGNEELLTTGPLYQVADGASCPFSLEINNAASPEESLPCAEVTYTFSIANGSGETMTGVELKCPLPPSFEFLNIVQNQFGGTLDASGLPGTFRMENLTIPGGVGKLVIKAEFGDIAGGEYNSQALLQNLPAGYGMFSPSDNPITPGFEDSTAIQVNRFDEDSLAFNWFVCHGDSIFLPAGEFGSNIQWSTGATSQQLLVTSGGLFTLEALSGCQTLFVSHEVTSASCPFTIEIAHIFEPDTLFACSELTFRFIIENTSGEVREGMAFRNILQEGFTFLGIQNNPYGGTLKAGLPSNEICIEGMTLKLGTDTLDLLVEAGDIDPGNYRNRAVLYNLPEALGPLRFSDDPRTLAIDSTVLHILGTHGDTLFFDTLICFGAELTLDASQLGKSFLWEDGSVAPHLVIEQPGDYHLTLFDGCNPAEVFYHVSEGTGISVVPIEPYHIHQGESIGLSPLITNSGDTLAILWTDSLGNSLSCFECLNPVSMPLESTIYGLKVSNEVCSDSIGVEVEVNTDRRIYAPNVFSANDDGINDYFFLQSPDFGVIHSLVVLDRWGNGVFSGKNFRFNELTDGWDGRRNGEIVTEGVYLWWAEVEFIDGKKEVFTGGILVVR